MPETALGRREVRPPTPQEPRRPGLPRAVVALGGVSLLTDVSSEMIYPLLPAFLTGLGAGPAFLGLLEGVAESTAALVKLASGAASDRAARRKPLVVAGYGLASVARPLIALASSPWHVLAVRFADRVGKGVRTSPRDAMLADVTPAAIRGRAYGFHRGMDHLGAVLGPLVAFLLLQRAGWSMRAVFALAAVPAVAALLTLLVAVREPPRAAAVAPRRLDLRPPEVPAFRRYLVVVALFTLGNSSDAFLLLRASSLGVPEAQLPLLWAVFHAAKSVLSTPFGALSDRIGRRRVIGTGFLLYALVYAGFAAAATAAHAWALFLAYAAFFALTEGAEKALVADLVPPDVRGRAFGTFHLVTGLLALPASALFGALWHTAGPELPFLLGAGLALAAAAGLAGTVRPARAAAAP
jgi:MFS family permease